MVSTKSMSDPGIVMYSQEWMDKHTPKYVPPIFRPLINEICRSYELGNSSDPKLVYDIIHNWLIDNDIEIKPSDVFLTRKERKGIFV